MATNFFLAPGAVGPIIVSSMLGRIALPKCIISLRYIMILQPTYLLTELSGLVMKQLKSKQTRHEFKSNRGYPTIYSQLASILACLLQLCFYIERPMGFHGCSCYCCKSCDIVSNIPCDLACIHCLLASARNIWINSVVGSRKREITCIAFVIDLSNMTGFRLTSS